MSEETQIKTATMAQIYFNQGYFEKAAAIYRHLLGKEPGRKEYLQGLSQSERHLAGVSEQGDIRIIPLLQEWIDLLIKYRLMKKLQYIQQSYHA